AVPPLGQRVVIPFHRSSLTAQIQGFLDEATELGLSMQLGDQSPTSNRDNLSTPNEIVLGIPGVIHLHSFRRFPKKPFPNVDAVLRLGIAVVGAVNVLSQEITLRPSGSRESYALWSVPNQAQ